MSNTEPCAKKPRTEDLDVWGDDWDGDVIDDCFRRATQESAENEVTLVSSYSIFKGREQILTSTQCGPSASKDGDVASKLRDLQAKYSEKEGEVAILRSNLNNLRSSYQTDQEKKQREWKDKLTVIEKEKKGIKSELEFKNFEIVNLKQQITELSRLINNEQRTQLSEIRSVVPSPEKRQEVASTPNFKIHISHTKSYPLQCFLRWTHCQETNVYAPGGLDCSNIFNALIPLTKLSSEELNSDHCNNCLKALHSTHQLLTNFHNQLEQIKGRCSSQDPKDVGICYPQTNKLKEVSFLCGEILDFFEKMAPHNEYLKNSFIQEGLCCSREFNGGQQGAQMSLLTLLMKIVELIGITRTEKYCNNFLSVLIKLLCTLCRSADITLLSQDKVKTFTKELVSLNLKLDLMNEINTFLSIIALSTNPISLLCSKPESEGESCRFIEYIPALEKSLFAVEDPGKFLKLGENILNLTYNVFKSDAAYLQENYQCECIIGLYKLTLGIIYKDVERYKEKSILEKRQRLLCLLITNGYDLTHKSITEYAQFKAAMYTLSKLDPGNVHLKNLQNFGVAEDFVDLPSEKFKGLNL